MADSHLHLTCDQVVELVSDYLELALETGNLALFEQHLNSCGSCVSYVEQVRTTVAVVGEVQPSGVPAEAKDRLMAAFRNWKAQ